MCKGTVCTHHLDPAVQHLEADYGYMKYVDAPNGIYTMVVDTRQEYQYASFRTNPGYGSSHVQPMVMLKDDGDGWCESADWSGVEGPGMPWEEDDTIPHADASRYDSYPSYLQEYYEEHNMPVPESVATASAAWRVESDRRVAEQQERWERQEEERRRAERAQRAATVRMQDARTMTFAQWREGYGDNPEEYNRLRGIQGMRADYVIQDEVHSYVEDTREAYSVSLAFWENASDGVRTASVSMHEAIEQLQQQLRELERATSQDSQDG